MAHRRGVRARVAHLFASLAPIQRGELDVIAGLGIVFLLVRVLGLGIRAFAVLNVCLAVCWIVLAYRTGRMYDEMAADHVEPEAHPGRVAA